MKEARRVWSGGSIRARMTLLYGGIFTTVALGVLLGAQQIQQIIVGQKVQDSPFVGNPGTAPLQDPAVLAKAQADLERTLINSQRVVTVVTLVLITVLAFAVCFWLTGRLLRPVHRITTTARRLSLSTLHERIALTGPRDELKELADTFDAMLDRLERAVDSQRRFVANASHELRTPLAIQRTAIEVGLADPTPEKVARIRAELLRNTLRSERLIEGLLVLAQGERGLDAHLPVDLEAVVEQVIEDHLPLAVRHGVALDVRTKPVVVSGDEVLLGRLAANLVHNAIRHNHPGGHVTVELSSDAVLAVRNSGPRVPPERVAELFQPFRRLNADRTGSADGAGLGLSIVAALVHAHGGAVRAQAQPEGGLAVTVTLPVAPAA
ncbi:HAMP domain-containing sensor histidine kinase [Herbidospora sp. NBRC 101105]|uniref:sensor histidine kinase n=1 Tax=Herbidospora sp. NBRC 101105 TaxID=3032195 RepID=UPI0024A37441|nr:HAMP domain-containing sensor histidine kinase [Herbidospora sp. NBRC 101105]GLX99197.1 two-component sensor histidine kinase [Herbidospora sp. NBRC 101105]